MTTIQWIGIVCVLASGFCAGLFIGYARGYGEGVRDVLVKRAVAEDAGE